MDNRVLLLVFASLVPLFTALVGVVIEAVSLPDSATVRGKHVKQILMCYFALFVLTGIGVAPGPVLPEVSLRLWPLTVFSLYMAPVLYYRFVVVLTDTGRKRTSPYSVHYVLPVVVVIVYNVLYFFVPFDVHLHLLKGGSTEEYRVTAFVFDMIPVMQLVLTVVYMVLAGRRLSACYRRHGEESPAWGRWLRLSQWLCVLSVAWSGAFCLTVWRWTAPWALPAAAVAAWAQAVLLCCHSFNRRSLLFLPLSILPVPLRTPFGERLSDRAAQAGSSRTYQRWTPAGNPVEVEPCPLTRKVFERQVAAGKLFLNPRLRLSDLTELFHTNRTYLSRFINREYGYGFSEYVNRLRLAELERLMRLPSNRGKPVNRLYAKAGFPNYQMYLRTKRKVKGPDDMPADTDFKNADVC